MRSLQEYPSDFEEAQQDLVFIIGKCFQISGKYREAERMHHQLLQLTEKALGQEHPDALSSMNSLAQVLGN